MAKNTTAGGDTTTATTPEEEARKAAEQQRASDDAFRFLNDKFKTQDKYKTTHGWPHWEEDKGYQPNDPKDPPNVGTIGENGYTPLKPGRYLLKDKGTKDTDLAYRVSSDFKYAGKDKNGQDKFLAEIEVRHGTADNHKRWKFGDTRSIHADAMNHADQTARAAVHFLAHPNPENPDVGFDKITVTFPDKFPFARYSERGTLGFNPRSAETQTLAYAQKYVKSTIDQAMKEGKEVEIDPRFFNVLHERKSSKTLAKYQNLVAMANKNSEQHDIVKSLDNSREMKNLQETIMKVPTLNAADIAKFIQGMENDIKAQADKIAALQAKMPDLEKAAIGKVPASPEVKALIAAQTKLANEQQLMVDLEAKKVGLEKNIDSYESFQQHKDQWEAAKNPTRDLKEAVRELTEAVKAAEADLSSYSDAQKDQFAAFKKDLKTLEDTLNKDLNKGQRTTATDDMQKIIDAMNKHDKFKEKAGPTIDKAENLKNGKKGQLDTDKRLADRAEVLLKGAEACAKRYQAYLDADPKKLSAESNNGVGMIIGRKGDKKRGEFVRLQTDDDAKEELDKNYGKGIKASEEFRQSLETEKKALQKEMSRGGKSPEKEKAMEKLNEAIKKLDAADKLKDKADNKLNGPSSPAAKSTVSGPGGSGS